MNCTYLYLDYMYKFWFIIDSFLLLPLSVIRNLKREKGSVFFSHCNLFDHCAASITEIGLDKLDECRFKNQFQKQKSSFQTLREKWVCLFVF